MVRVIWIAASAVAIVALLWFIIVVVSNGTAIGPAGPFILQFVWFPTLIFATVSIICIVKGRTPAKLHEQIILILFLTIFSIIFSGTLLREPSFERHMREVEEINRQWMEESSRITVDGRFEYRLNFMGTLTNAPRAWLSMRDIATDDNLRIYLNLRFEELGAVHQYPAKTRALWIKLSPTDADYIWILTTTPYLKEEIEVFEINMETGTSRRIGE